MSTVPPRVFVTGIGITSPIGKDWEGNVQSLKRGHSNFREIDFFDVSRQRTKTAGIARDIDDLPESRLSQKELRRLDRGTKLLLQATAEALESVTVSFDSDEPIPLIVGTSAAAMPIGESFYRQSVAGGSLRGQLTKIEHYQPQRQLTTVGHALGFTPNALIISNACASGANAIGHAFQMLRAGQSQTALAGGFDALSQLVFAGFDTLQALAESGIPRPFDANRDGLALGEGAAMFFLETEESVQKSGSTVLAEVVGYGVASDLHHLTQPHPDGIAATCSMTAACKQAGLTAKDIDYLNSHGTGTPLNDVAEANAIAHWAGTDARGIAVSSTKSATGHLLGGAGAVESAYCLAAILNQFTPASLNVRTPDEAITFDLVQEPREQKITHALTNSFGFGGSNATLIFKAASS